MKKCSTRHSILTVCIEAFNSTAKSQPSKRQPPVTGTPVTHKYLQTTMWGWVRGCNPNPTGIHAHVACSYHSGTRIPHNRMDATRHLIKSEKSLQKSQHRPTHAHAHPHGPDPLGGPVHLLGRVGGLHRAAGRGSLGLELLHPDAGLVEAEQVPNELAEIDAPTQ